MYQIRGNGSSLSVNFSTYNHPDTGFLCSLDLSKQFQGTWNVSFLIHKVQEQCYQPVETFASDTNVLELELCCDTLSETQEGVDLLLLHPKPIPNKKKNSKNGC